MSGELARELDDYLGDDRDVTAMLLVGLGSVGAFWLVMWFFVEAWLVTFIAATLMAMGNTAIWLAANESLMRDEFGEHLREFDGGGVEAWTLSDVREAYAEGRIGEEEMERRVEALVGDRPRDADLDEWELVAEEAGEKA